MHAGLLHNVSDTLTGVCSASTMHSSHPQVTLSSSSRHKFGSARRRLAWLCITLGPRLDIKGDAVGRRDASVTIIPSPVILSDRVV